MKSLFVKLGVILFIGIVIFGCAGMWGARWRLYDRDDEYKGYYNAKAITHPSEDIVRVWQRWEYTDKGVIEKVKVLGKKYENINQTTVLNEINCSEKKWRTLSLNHYSKEGEVIFSTSQEGQWDYIVPNSRVGALYKAVCK
jgi:hypothetical protein